MSFASFQVFRDCLRFGVLYRNTRINNCKYWKAGDETQGAIPLAEANYKDRGKECLQDDKLQVFCLVEQMDRAAIKPRADGCNHADLKDGEGCAEATKPKSMAQHNRRDQK